MFEAFLIVGAAYLIWELVGGEATDVEESRFTIEREHDIRRNGTLSDPRRLATKQYQLLERGVELPQRDDDGKNPARYEALIDQKLEETAKLAYVYRPMEPSRLDALDTKLPTASRTLMDLHNLSIIRERPRERMDDNNQ